MDFEKNNQPQEAPAEETQTAPVVPVVEEKAPVQEAPAQSTINDISMCANCLGQGLLGDPAGANSICPTCNGTGVLA